MQQDEIKELRLNLGQMHSAVLDCNGMMDMSQIPTPSTVVNPINSAIQVEVLYTVCPNSPRARSQSQVKLPKLLQSDVRYPMTEFC